MKALMCTTSDDGFCCGITEIGIFQDSEDTGYGVHEADLNYQQTLTATTIASQKFAIKRLKALGFQRVKRFKRVDDGKTWITIWVRVGTKYAPKARIKNVDDEKNDSPWHEDRW